jgi:hypothetical protein
VTSYGDRVPAAHRPVIVDTDGGIDDAAVRWWASTDPSLDVLAVTTLWGNVDVRVDPFGHLIRRRFGESA